MFDTDQTRSSRVGFLLQLYGHVLICKIQVKYGRASGVDFGPVDIVRFAEVNDDLKDAYAKGRICELDYKLLKEMISDSINNMGHLL